MTNNNNNIRNLILTPKLVELGFTDARIIGKLLILRIGETAAEEIRCKFDKNDLIKTTGKYLNDAIANNSRFTPEDKDSICTNVCTMLVKSIEHGHEEKQEEAKQEHQNTQKILDDIKQLREQNANLNFEQWQSTLQYKYEKLQNVVQQTMPEIWSGLEFELSILRVLNIEGCTLPFIGIILGRPSSYKTVIISLMKRWCYAFYTDNFTARSFVSHSTAVNSPEDLEQIDMLPKIRGRLFLTPELSPMFTAKEEDLIQLLGIITRIADGHGYVSDSGAHGHRGYDEDIMFTWVGAAVDIPYKVYKVLGNLGAKLYFFRMKFDEETPDQLLDYAIVGEEFNYKVLEVQNALFDYLKWFEIYPTMTSNNNITPKLKWDKSNDSRDALKYIVGMADLLSYLRCVAQVWETNDSQGSDYAYSISQREVPRRAITCLYNLARGHALLTGRNNITLEDIPMIIKTALNTAPIERVSLFSLLIANNGKLTTTQILQSLNVARKTALRTMAELKAIGLVDMEDYHEPGQNNLSKMIMLNPRFNWFLSDSMITKIYPHTIHNFSKDDYEFEGGNGHGQKEDMLWQTYGPLEEQQEQDPTNHMQTDKNTVGGAQLRERLVSSGHFSDEEPIQIISDMVKVGRLKEVMLDTYRRV